MSQILSQDFVKCKLNSRHGDYNSQIALYTGQNETLLKQIHSLRLKGTYPNHCIKGNYTELDSGSRFYDLRQRQSGEYCDSKTATKKSSDYNGPNWYRVTGRAGTRLATNHDIKVSLDNKKMRIFL